MTESEELQMWVVVCTDLHVANGPYQSPTDALMIAKRMTKESNCVFIPVPLLLKGQVMHEPPRSSHEKYSHYGTYI